MSFYIPIIWSVSPPGEVEEAFYTLFLLISSLDVSSIFYKRLSISDNILVSWFFKSLLKS